MPSPAILRRRKPPVLEEVEEEEEQAEPTLSERRANARRVADLLLELDDERDCVDALYAAAQRALADWAIEFVTVRKRDPTSAEVRESPVWPFVRKKTAEAEVRRLALNQTLSTMGQPSMPQPSADRGRRAADRTAGTAAEGATAVGTSYGTFNNERARLLLLRALEPRVLQPPDATAEAPPPVEPLPITPPIARTHLAPTLAPPPPLRSCAPTFARSRSPSSRPRRATTGSRAARRDPPRRTRSSSRRPCSSRTSTPT